MNTNVSVTVSSGSYEVSAIAVTGLKGDTGATGSPNTLSIGTVTTVSPGGSATASVTGTAPTQTLNLGIPTGATGATNSLAIGTVSTVAAGGSATATITGTAPNQTLNLGIPTGATGAQGSWAAAQPNRTWSSSTTLVTGDAGYLILVDSSTAISVTSSLGLSVGQRVDFLITSATVPTISATAPATITGTPLPAGGVKFRAQYSAATLICTASNTYVLVGDLAAA